MTSFQSSLGDDVAEELAEGQREISIAEFFEKNKHMLGFDSGARGLVTAVKEGVDNSLDACEEAGIRPDIYVEIREVGDYYRVVIEDNGPGITREEIPKVFGKLLYGSRFHKREQSLTPDQELLIKRDGKVETLPIGVLCDAYLGEDGADVQPIPDDIEAPSFDRETHDISWQPVTHAIRHETDGSTYTVNTERGRSVEVTGDHSLFTISASGETEEVAAADLEAGDTILAPQNLPSPVNARTVNVLEHIPRGALAERRMYVYGFDRDTLASLKEGTSVHRRATPESDRKRTYYEVDGVEILKDSLEQNYLPQGYLPAAVVQDLGWESLAAEQGCELRTYQVGGAQTGIPVSIDLNEEFVRMLGYYIAEGHADARQVGFTFGSHEGEMIATTEQAVTSLGGSTTTVERERNSTRVKGFASPLALFLKAVCGNGAHEKRVPSFIFEAAPELQEEFLTAVYQGDGSDSVPTNELSHCTASEELAQQLSVLWSMRGVVASLETRRNKGGYSDDPSTMYITKVYGEDAELGSVFKAGEDAECGTQRYKRVPTSVLDEVRVEEVGHTTVPDTIPGLLMGAGVGSNLEHAATYQSVIERALDGEFVTTPRYVHNLQEKGLLDSDHQPTDDLVDLWEAVHSLQGLTETDVCLLPVKSVQETEPPEHVYDISVPGATGRDENFVVVNEGPLAVKNSRGQQGIGISAAVLYSQLTSGKPARITSRTQGREEARYFEVIIDTETNEPEIRADEATTWDRPHGTRIEMEMEANMRARQRLHDYIEHTAVVNPHARIELSEPAADFKFERGTDQLPAETEEIRPHPHGVELGTLLKMMEETDSYSLSGFLQGEFTRVGAKTTDNVLEAFMDRYAGRELTWRPPGTHEDVDIRRAVQEAVANKGREPTAAFADQVGKSLGGMDRVAHGDVVRLVDEAADAVASEFDVTFGSTVRGNAVDAAWAAITADIESDLYLLVDEATTERKDDATVQGLAERIAGYVTDETGSRHRVTRDTLRTFVDDAADRVEEYEEASIGGTARENIVDVIWSRTRPVPDDRPSVSTVRDDRDAASDLLDAMLAVDIISPPTDCLAPITEAEIEAGLKKEYDADFYAAATRDAAVHGGDPFIVEAGIAYGGEIEDDGEIDLMRFANRVPLVYQRGACAITDVVTSINWRNYGLDQPGGTGMPGGPAVVLVHVASTNVPFTSESKDAVANVPEIEDEIELALREAARELKSHINRRQEMQQRRRKRNVLADILPTMARKVSELVADEDDLEIDDSLARIMNNVLVERQAENGSVTLRVENHSSTNADLEITDIVPEEPADLSAGSVVEMDGEWFVSWEPTVDPGGTAELSYETNGTAESDLSVSGLETERLTVDQ